MRPYIICHMVAPLIAEGKDKPLFYDAATQDFELICSKVRDGVLILNFKKGEKMNKYSKEAKKRWGNTAAIRERCQ